MGEVYLALDTKLLSPDGRYIVFHTSPAVGIPHIFRMDIGGGNLKQLDFDEQASPPRYRVALIPFEGGPPVKVFDVPPRSNQWFMIDERTLLYQERNGDVGNIWSRPIDGGAPKQLTNFTSEYIFQFAPSRDGRQFAVSRGTSSADIILIKDFR